MEKVYFIKGKFLENLSKIIAEQKQLKGKVAVKAHFGEFGNLTHLRPQIVGTAVEALKANGAMPFAFDTPTLYEGSRSTPEKYFETARKNGFVKETIGCPIVISDKSKSLSGKKFLQKVEMAEELLTADSLLVISHFKGHGDAGFGGCIKNIGMGCVSKASKKDQHTLSQPVFSGECKGCGSCMKACKQEAVQLKSGKPVFKYDFCFGCGACILACPQKCLKPKVAGLQELLAETAAVVLEKFKGNVFFVNALFDITQNCDCCENPGRIVCENIGVLASKDIVALDNASLELVEQKAGKVLDELSKVKANGQIEAAEQFGLGKKEFEILEIE